MVTSYHIRAATAVDAEILVSFTLREAREAERYEANEAEVRRGVAGGLGESPFAQYWVAESQGEVVGSISVVKEWSNFRGGMYWWIQSLFIVPAHRGAGLVELLLDHVGEAARAGGALDLRLYAHASNDRALRAYRRCGFSPAPYVVLTRAVSRTAR